MSDKRLTFVIGDIHGEFDSLRLLVNKLPKDSNLILVGDLVDRGRKSKEVIEFIRKNNYKCVLGNHEELMIHYGELLIKKYPNIPYMGNFHNWIYVGGKQTLLSYGLIEIDKYDGKLICTQNDDAFNQFKDDIAWLKTLPLYIELEEKKDNKPIVISHAAVGNVWHFAKDEKNKEVFTEYALWNRKMPNKKSEIFNIFGHTIVQNADIQEHYVNVDTGCHFEKEGYGKLSAYCVESGEVIIQ